MYYYCHLVTSWVSGHRPGRTHAAVSRVTVARPGRARLSPLAPTCHCWEAGSRHRGESQLVSLRPGQYTQCSPEAQKMLSTRRRSGWLNRQMERALSPLDLVGPWFGSALGWLNLNFVGWGAVSKKCWLSSGVFTLITGKLDTDWLGSSTLATNTLFI